MNIEFKEQFINLWKKYFGEAELPITFYYTEGDGGADRAEKQKGWNCLICDLAKVRNGSMSGKMYFHLPYPWRDSQN
jgi:hypothetical protein